MACSAEGIIPAGLAQAQDSIHREVNLIGIIVLLPVVLPPADGAQSHRPGRFEGSCATARAAKENQRLHVLVGRVFGAAG